MLSKSIFAAALVSIGLAGLASAQTANTCLGRAVIDAVWQTGVGGNNYEYFFALRNDTRGALIVDVSITGFPGSVTIMMPSLPSIPLGLYGTATSWGFGRGTMGNMNVGSVGTVARVYDAASSAGPTIRLTNCRAR